MQAYLWLLIAVVTPGTAGAQELYKCLQGSAVTYSSSPCEKLGLKPGGEIRDRVTTLPLGSAKDGKGPRAPRDAAAKAAGKENEVDMPSTSAIKPVNPLIEKLAK